MPGFDRAIGQRECPRAVLRDHRTHELEQEVATDQPQHRRHLVHRHALAGKRDDLIQGALRIAHAPLGGARDERQRRVRRVDPLRGRDPAKLIRDRLRRDRPELEHLRPGQDGVRNLVQLGGRHHEDDVRGRLLDRLEQRVERRSRQLVDFVDDEDLVAVANRRDRQAGNHDLADVVDARMARGVDLEDVDVAPLGDLDARVTRAARFGGRTLHAVQRLRQDPRRRRLAASARTGKHERVGDAPARDGVAQRLRHRLLADDLIEPLRTPLAGENLVGPWNKCKR